jgi:hypothetical protein
LGNLGKINHVILDSGGLEDTRKVPRLRLFEDKRLRGLENKRTKMFQKAKEIKE